jgi:hypothetical protein
VGSDGDGIPLGWVVAPVSTHDSPLLAPTLEPLAGLVPLSQPSTVHLDQGYDSGKPHTTLAERGLDGHIAHKGTPASIPGRQLGLVERVHACGAPLASSAGTRSGLRVVDFYLTLAHAIPIVRRLVRRAWTYPRRHVVDIVQAAVVGLARQIRTADAHDR